MKECCLNCKYLFHALYNCQGMEDLENEKCHEYIKKIED